MTQKTYESCLQFVENRDRAREVFPWSGGAIHACCAGLYSTQGLTAEAADLAFCRDLLRERTGVFSNFRGTIQAPLAALLDISRDPRSILEWGLWFYDELKGYFMTSPYLPLAAMLLGWLAPEEGAGELVERTRAIYRGMQANHPFLTGGEDSAFCALMALSSKSDEALLDDMEGCYRFLKPHFFSANAVQSLSHALAVYEGPVEDKCSRTLDLVYLLRDRGRKYGTEFELPTLGVLAQAGGDLERVADEMLEIDDWLSGCPGFGLLGAVTAKQRLMYAGMLAQRDWLAPEAMASAGISSTAGLLIAQQVATMSAISAAHAASGTHS